MELKTFCKKQQHGIQDDEKLSVRQLLAKYGTNSS